MRVAYVLSDEFDYSTLICDDAGPAIARDYGLQPVVLDKIGSEHDFLIVDPWFQPGELGALEAMIRARPKRFILRVTDPIWSVVRDQAWYKFTERMMCKDLVHIVLTYPPADLTAYYFSIYPNIRFLYAPFVYDDRNERPIDHADRGHLIAMTGNPNRSVYPLRYTISQVVKYYPPLRSMTRTLKHPGYNILESKNALVRDNYIDFLSQHRFATVCGSYCKVELLKYREFGYAGVVPLGEMPSTLPDCPPNAWVKWRRNFVALHRQLRAIDDTQQRAEAFRQYMRQRRGREAMRSLLHRQLATL